tara:strand:- start:133 stop:348 length:216 start_codon:yes stop_codon:yes gene_type:complete
MTPEDLKRVDTRVKAIEFFTIELDHATNNISLSVNGQLRNKIHTLEAESLFEKILKIIKLKFIKIRNEIKN